MIGLLYKLIVGNFHFHEWKTYKIHESFDLDYNSRTGENHYQKCDKCGDVRIKKLRF